MPNNLALLPLTRPRIPALLALVDGYPDQNHKLTTGLGGAPLENGAFITDHAVAQPEELTLTGYVSNLSDALGARPTLAWQAIRRLHQALTPISAITPWNVYTEMIIAEVHSQPTGLGMSFTIKLQEIQRVSIAGESPLDALGLFGRDSGLAGGLLGTLGTALGESGAGVTGLISSGVQAIGGQVQLPDIVQRITGPAIGRTAQRTRGRIVLAAESVLNFTSFF